LYSTSLKVAMDSPIACGLDHKIKLAGSATHAKTVATTTVVRRHSPSSHAAQLRAAAQFRHPVRDDIAIPFAVR
jgi:hypothetical protein